jgi:hypothetical protein
MHWNLLESKIEVIFLSGIGFNQRFDSLQIYKRKRVSAIIIDETYSDW